MATTSWPSWGTTVRVQTTDPAALRSARRLVELCLRAGEKAADGERARSEVQRITRSGGRPVLVSPLLADLVVSALDAAAMTEGACDPTVGNATAVLAAANRRGRDGSLFPVCGGGSATASLRPARGWHTVHVEDRRVVVPAGVHLDLSATTKAFMATGAAVFASRHTGVGVLVDLGGDVASYGVAPSGGWTVAPAGEVVRLHPGEALATSHGRGVVDPRTGRAIQPVWRSISVRSSGCISAKALAVAALVAGVDAPELLESRGVAARLESQDGVVLQLTGWDGHRADGGRRHLAAAS